jgi:FkbM family methyltransferase
VANLRDRLLWRFRAIVKAARLGSSPGARVRAVVLAAVWPLVARLVPAVKRMSLDVSIPGGSHRITLGDWSELYATIDVLVDEVYALDLEGQPETIVDLGSNVGTSVLWFRARYPAARILAVEPDPRAFERLKANVGALEGVSLIEAAAAGMDGSLELHRGPTTWGSSLRGWGSPVRGAGSGVTVRTASLGTLLAEAGFERVGLLKFDVEGAEADVLEGFDEWQRVDAVIGELHDFPGLEARVHAVLERAGFVVRVGQYGDECQVRATRAGPCA